MIAHLSGETLVRLLDGEVSGAERAQLAAHLGDCVACARDRAAVESQTRALVAFLERTDPLPRAFALAPRPHATRTPLRWWQVAAAVVLLIGAAVSLPTPVRAWILERWADVRHAIGGPARAVEQPAPDGALVSSGGVSFLPASDVLYVRVATRQSAGQLFVVWTDAERVSAGASAGRGGAGAEFVVLPGELRITNAARSHASYRVAVPRRLKHVVVSIDGEPPTVIVPARTGEGQTTISLETRMP